MHYITPRDFFAAYAMQVLLQKNDRAVREAYAFGQDDDDEGFSVAKMLLDEVSASAFDIADSMMRHRG